MENTANIIPVGTAGEYFGPTGTGMPRPFVTTRAIVLDSVATFTKIAVRFDDTGNVGAVSWANVDFGVADSRNVPR